MEITSSPGLSEPEEIRSMAVYDPETGRIVHRHHVVRLAGAPPRSEAELEERAIELARAQTGHDGPLAVHHAEPGALDRPGAQSIDPKTGRLRTEDQALSDLT